MTRSRSFAARRTAFVALAAAVALAPLGCIRGTLPARELYRLAVPDSASVPDGLAPAAPGTGTPGTIAIAPYVAPGLYAEPSIAYRIGDSEYGTYPSREWAVPLSQMLGVLTERVLARSPLTSGGAIFDPPSLRSQTYLWRGTVREFEEVDRGKDVFAAVGIDAALLRTADDSVLWTGSVHLERPVGEPTMAGVVTTLSALATEAVQRLAVSADSALRRRPAAAARGHD